MSILNNRALGRVIRQKGAIDIVTLLAVAAIGLLIVCGIKVAPVYIEHWSIKDILKGVQEESASEGGKVNERILRKKISSRVDVNRLEFLTADDIYIERDVAGYQIDINYERRIDFLFNIDLLIEFDDAQVLVESASD